jgi:hypothetical protein
LDAVADKIRTGFQRLREQNSGGPREVINKISADIQKMTEDGFSLQSILDVIRGDGEVDIKLSTLRYYLKGGEKKEPVSRPPKAASNPAATPAPEARSNKKKSQKKASTPSEPMAPTQPSEGSISLEDRDA